MLAEKVTAGELPPLEERLAVNPLVVEPYEALRTMAAPGEDWGAVTTQPI